MQCKQTVVIQGVSSQPVSVSSGVPQGTVLGPLLFLVYINDIVNGLSSNACLFADDCVIYRKITSPADCEIIQQDLKTLEEWEQRWQMSFKPDKCSVIRFTNKKNIIESSYVLSGHVLESVKSHKYLGVHLSSDMKWNTHIDAATAKANSMLGFLRRNLGTAPRKVKLQAYKSLVRPHLEYCGSVWDPFTTNNKHKIEMVQRRAARFITNTYSWDSTTSVTALLQELELPTMENRRFIQRLTNFHKIIHNQIDVKLPSEITVRQPEITTRRSKPNYLQVPFTGIKAFKHSFFIQTSNDWNDLPQHTTNISDTKQFSGSLVTYKNQ